MAKQKKRGTPTNVALDASKQKEFNQKIHNIKEKKSPVTASPAENIPGVVYISRLPWGFEDQPMKEYFKQFGTIKRIRVARSKKTGNSKGYAYIQFTHDDVAKIVAETMNNYLMFGKLIKCKHLQRPHPATFKHARRQFLTPVAQKHAISERNKPKTEETLEKNKAKLLTKFRKKMAQLSEQGIEYSVVGMDVPKKTELEKIVKTEPTKQPRKRKPSDEWKTMGTPETKKQLKTPKSMSRKENDIVQEKSETKTPKTKTPKKIETKTPMETQTKTPKKIGTKTPNPKTPKTIETITPMETQTKTPKTKTPKKIKMKTPMETQTKTPNTKTPMKTDTKTPKITETKTPKKTPKNLSLLTKTEDTPKGKKTGTKTPKKTPKTPKNLALIPKTVDTPNGKMNVVVEDSDEEEISFKTPPQSIKSSKLEVVTDSDSTPVTPVVTPVSRRTRGGDKNQGSKSAKTPIKSAGRKSFGGKGALKATPSKGKRRSQ